MTKKDRLRLSLDVSKSVKDRLDRLRENTDAESSTEVVRRALAIYETLVDLVMDGAHLQAVDENGKARPVTLLAIGPEAAMANQIRRMLDTRHRPA